MKTKTGLMVTASLLLVPVLAPARSEYAACMEAKLKLSAPNISAYRRPLSRQLAGSWMTGVEAAGVEYRGYANGVDRAVSNMTAATEADRVSSMIRECRHLRKSTPPKFRVLGIR